MRRRPVLAAATDINEKILQDLFAFSGMIHLGMELQSVQGLRDISIFPEGRNRNALCGGHQFKSGWQFKDGIGMAHPNL